MIIGIDARFYGPEGKGLGRYTQRLIEYLEKIDRENRYVIFLSEQGWNTYQPSSPNFIKVRANCRWYTLAEQVVMPWLIWKNKIGLMHWPHFNVSIFSPAKFVVTIHDLILLKFPTRRASTLDPIRYFLKQVGYKAVIAHALKNSQKIITVSQFTKSDIVKNFPKVSPGKIDVIYEACDSVESGQLKLPDRGLQKNGITKPFILYVGNAYPHKNLERLIRVFSYLDKVRPGIYQLVLVGKEDYFYSRLKEFSREIKLSRADQLIFLGYSSEAMLADLYRNASAYVFPSLLEGFGLPPLEAMRYDLPVAASNNSSCPEILGEAAAYFNPIDDQDILDSLLRVLEDNALRSRLMESGRQQVLKYSWQDCARQTLAAYNTSL